MAAVNSWDDIPGGIADEGTCSNNSADCYAAYSSLSSLLDSYMPILATIGDTLTSLESAITTTSSVQACFDGGAYDDGQCEYSDNLGTYTTDLTTVQTDLTSFKTSLGTTMDEIVALMAYCEDRADTWSNAALFIHQENEKLNNI